VNTTDGYALSVRQPWAELIISGRKSIETRAWTTDYRGILWLHAGRHVDAILDAKFAIVDPPRGAFVGCVELVSVTTFDASRWEAWRGRHLDPGPYGPGLYAWAVANPQRLREPVPGVGRLGLFAIKPALEVELRSRLPASMLLSRGVGVKIVGEGPLTPLFRLAFLRTHLFRPPGIQFRGAPEAPQERVEVSDEHYLEVY
jgi:hypothetical protein